MPSSLSPPFHIVFDNEKRKCKTKVRAEFQNYTLFHKDTIHDFSKEALFKIQLLWK